jgi:hypothetical protein
VPMMMNFFGYDIIRMFWGLGQNPFGWAFLAGVFFFFSFSCFSSFYLLSCPPKMVAYASDLFIFVSAFLGGVLAVIHLVLYLAKLYLLYIPLRLFE